MKRLFIVLSLILLNFAPAFSDETADNATIKETIKLQGQIQYDDNPVETIYLDENIEKPQVNIPQRSLTLPVGIINITSNANTTRSALARSSVNRRSLGDILPLAGSVTEKVGGFSYGQTWEQELSYSQMEDTTAFFLRYDTPKYLSLTTSIRQSTNQDLGNQYNTLRVAPEWHLTKNLTLKDSFTSYMNLPKNKNAVTLIYTPSLQKYAESLKFELEVAESYYRNGQRSSAVSFSTGFKL